MLAPDGKTVDVDTFRTVWDDGLHVISHHAILFPWCPLKVERQRLGQVVGTDSLVGIEIKPAVRIQPRRGH